MADDNTVIQDESGFVPEPVPDSIADVEINGLEPAQSDESEPADTGDVNADNDQPEEQSEAEETDTEQPEQTEPETQAEQQEQPDAKEVARQKFLERQQARAERDYVAQERQRIREYEQNTDTSDLEERLKIMEAKDYVNTVERNRQSIQRDVAAAQEIPFFKSGTEQSQLLFQQALENYANAYGVVDTDTGEWIGAQDRYGNDVPLLPYLQQQAATYEQALKDAKESARVEVQQSEAKMRAKAVNPSNTGKARSSGDDLDDLLERVGDVPLW